MQPSQLGLHLCKRVRTPRRDNTKFYLIVRFQFWTFGECGVPLHFPSLISWGCKIHQLHLCRDHHSHECPVHDIKQSDGEPLVMLQLWGM